MSLSCSCDFDGDEPEWYWWPSKDYTTFGQLRATRCMADCCNTRIKFGSIVVQVERTRAATEWEELRGIADCDDPYAVKLATHYLCEECADLYFSFDDLGFECVSPYENMRDLAKEYHEVYGGGNDKRQT